MEENKDSRGGLKAIHCDICASEFDEKHLRCLVSCGHDSICTICHLRLRCILRDFTCPMCKGESENIISVKHDDTSDQVYSDYDLCGVEYFPGYIYNHRARMFFPPKHNKVCIEPLWKCYCKECKVLKRDIKALRAHLNAEHNLQMCSLCIEHKQAFPSEQKVYSQQEYEKHLNQGDGDGSEGHPPCKLCHKKRFYDNTALFLHLTKDHYTCFICEKAGIKFLYFRNYDKLQDHFETKHYACTQPECLQQKFVVFDNEFSLLSHTSVHHPHLVDKSNNPFHFKTKSKPRKARSVNTLMDNSSHVNNRSVGSEDGNDISDEWQVEVNNMINDDEPLPSHHVEEGIDYIGTHENGGIMDMASQPNGLDLESFPSLASISITGAASQSNNWSNRGGGRGNGRRDLSKRDEDAYPALSNTALANPALGKIKNKSKAKIDYSSINQATDTSPPAVTVASTATPDDDPYAFFGGKVKMKKATKGKYENEGDNDNILGASSEARSIETTNHNGTNDDVTSWLQQSKTKAEKINKNGVGGGGRRVARPNQWKQAMASVGIGVKKKGDAKHNVYMASQSSIGTGKVTGAAMPDLLKSGSFKPLVRDDGGDYSGTGTWARVGGTSGNVMTKTDRVNNSHVHSSQQQDIWGIIQIANEGQNKSKQQKQKQKKKNMLQNLAFNYT